MATIGNVQQILIKSYDTLNNEYETNISKGFTINSGATYAEVDEATRAVIALTTNTYDDSILVTNISLNEAIQEG